MVVSFGEAVVGGRGRCLIRASFCYCLRVFGPFGAPRRLVPVDFQTKGCYCRFRSSNLVRFLVLVELQSALDLRAL